MINSNVTPASQFSRQEQTFHDGGTTTHVTSETHTGQRGDVSYRQTHTERLTTTNAPQMYRTASPSQHAIRRSPSPLAPVSRFQVSNFAPSAPQNNQWCPPGPNQGMVVSAPSGVSVQQNPDRSLTMTIGLGGPGEEAKENMAPYGGNTGNINKPLGPPMFKVTKVTTTQPKGLWTPAGGMAPKPTPIQQQRTPSPRMDTQRKWQPPQHAPPVFKPAPAPAPAPKRYQPEPEPDLDQDVPITEADFRGGNEPPLPIDIQKLMFGGRNSECSTPDSPATLERKSKSLWF